MKKFIIIALAAIAMFSAASCTSCNRNAEPALLYDLTATATGKVDFSWFNGGASVDGNATVFQCNDSTKNVVRTNVYSLEEAFVSNDTEVVTAATRVKDLFYTNVKVTGVQGEYQLGITGYVKYGNIWFAIDEHYPPLDTTEVVQ